MSRERTLSLREAAAELGVHYMTVYRYVRLGMLPATKAGAAWVVAADDLAGFRNVRPENGERRSPADWQQRLRARMQAGDERGSWRVVESALASGLDPVDVYEEMLAPAMTAVGEDWANGVIDVADEHRASAVAVRIVGRLGPRFARRGRSKGSVVTATPAGELHGLGLSVVADVLRGAGYEVVDLGCNVPPQSLARTVDEAPRLRAVALSAHNPEGGAGLREAIAVVRPLTDAPIVVGGHAVSSEAEAHTLGADGWAANARQAVARIAELTS